MELQSDCFLFLKVDVTSFSGVRLRTANILSLPNNYF